MTHQEYCAYQKAETSRIRQIREDFIAQMEKLDANTQSLGCEACWPTTDEYCRLGYCYRCGRRPMCEFEGCERAAVADDSCAEHNLEIALEELADSPWDIVLQARVVKWRIACAKEAI